MMCDNKSAARYVDLGSHSCSGDRDHLRLATLHKVPDCHGEIEMGLACVLSLITVFKYLKIENVSWFETFPTLKNKQAIVSISRECR